MPQWVLNCPSCGKVFRHSEIERSSENLLYDALWPYRPEVPEDGLRLKCPDCQRPATYHRFQLMYSSG